MVRLLVRPVTLTVSKLAKNHSMFRSFTGLDISEFDSLYGRVGTKYDEFEEERRSRPDRKRDFGESGRKFKLGLQERLLMLSICYHLYITHA